MKLSIVLLSAHLLLAPPLLPGNHPYHAEQELSIFMQPVITMIRIRDALLPSSAYPGYLNIEVYLNLPCQ